MRTNLDNKTKTDERTKKVTARDHPLRGDLKTSLSLSIVDDTLILFRNTSLHQLIYLKYCRAIISGFKMTCSLLSYCMIPVELLVINNYII